LLLSVYKVLKYRHHCNTFIQKLSRSYEFLRSVTFACMIICAARVILILETPKYHKEMLQATWCQAIDYARCCTKSHPWKRGGI